VFNGSSARPDCIPAVTTEREPAQSVPAWEAQATPRPEQINPAWRPTYRRRLHNHRRPLDLSPVRLAPRVADAGGYRVTLRLDPVHRRHRDCDGLGADAIRFFARACDPDVQDAGGAAGFMALSIVVFVILGSVLEGVPALVLLAPLLFPIARQLGIHEVHYSMVVILAMGIGLFAPPFGVGFFTACAIGNVDPDDAVSRIWPYLAALLIGTIVVAAVPWLSIGFL
jgi:Tripartite ATP-independent periplasmic transporter, DctM component